jgi:thiamine biosynthesis lipoprotein ApbE
VVTGQVTLSLEDYHSLVDSAKKTAELRENTELLIKELQVFLSFMSSRSEIEPYIVEFNKQSRTSIIEIADGIAKIKKK